MDLRLFSVIFTNAIIYTLINPAETQGVEGRYLRPSQDKTCDRNGRCTYRDGLIKEVVETPGLAGDTQRPPVLTRDGFPASSGEGQPGIGADYKPNPNHETNYSDYAIKPVTSSDISVEDPQLGSGRDEYKPRPLSERDEYKPRPTSERDEYKPRPLSERDEYKPRPLSERDEYKPEPVFEKDIERPPVLTRDGYPASSGEGRPGIGTDYKPKPQPVSGTDEYKPRPGSRRDEYQRDLEKDEYKPKAVGETRPKDFDYSGEGYIPKPDTSVRDNFEPKRDDFYPEGTERTFDKNNRNREDRNIRGGYGSHNPKPPLSRDEQGQPSRGGYIPKPAIDRDYPGSKPGDGGYVRKPEVDRDDYIPRPVGSGGGYYPKPGYEDYVPKPDRDDRGDYYPKPDGSNRRPIRPIDEDRKDLGGYDKPKYDDYGESYGDGAKDKEYIGDGGKPKPVSGGGNCICVPYYQCEDGHIVTDGAGIIDARKKPEPDEDLPLDGKFNPPSCGPFHVCCNTPESSTVKPYEHKCGVRNPSGINSRILSPSNKGEADFGEWPWQAAVLKAEGKVNIFQCGGVLIDKYHVLTVAHCVFHLYKFNEYPLKVRLGEWDTQTTTEFLAHEDYKVSKILVHPEYRNTSLWNDVAILRLEDPVLFAPHIDTVCLPQYDEMFAEQNCVVTGWGKDAYKGGTFSNVMKEVALQVIDNYKCEEMLRKTRLGRFFNLYEGFLCAGGEYGLDSCKGDGGGPLVCYRKDKSYALAGLVSWGIDCGQPGVPGVYLKVQKYLDWISKSTGVHLQDYWPKRT